MDEEGEFDRVKLVEDGRFALHTGHEISSLVSPLADKGPHSSVIVSDRL